MYNALLQILQSSPIMHNPQIIDLKINFPHHFHNDQGGVKPSILQGDPLQDLLDVLGEIEDYYLVVD